MSVLQAMYREWPFFQTTLSNMDMVLAKSDIAIASRYAELVPERELRNQIFQRVRAEWQSSIDMLLASRNSRWPARSGTASPISIRLTPCRSSLRIEPHRFLRVQDGGEEHGRRGGARGDYRTAVRPRHDTETRSTARPAPAGCTPSGPLA